MAIQQMTADQYKQKYGTSPVFHAAAPEVPQKSLGQKIGNAAKGIVDFIGAGPIAETFGTELAKIGKPKAEKDILEKSYPSQKAVIGSAIQTGANLIPGVGVGAGLATKIGVGAATGLAFDVGSKLQQNKSVGQAITPGIGTAVGAALPLAGAGFNIAKSVTGRLMKGLGSGLSGVSTETIDKIVSNPEMAQKASQKLAQNGNNKVLEENARTIINGVGQIKKEARAAFGRGLEQLQKTDIDHGAFKANTQRFLDKYGSVVKNGQRTIANAEFDNPKNIEKASELIDKLSKVNLDLNGASLRKLANDIENAAYKTTGTDAERLSFNAFTKELSATLKDSISLSTSKLNDINHNFSQDMQLAEAVEGIFGKVNFKNLPEVVKASQKLENVFAQKGLAPQVVDDFLSRIGVSSKDFKTTEAVRQISNKTTGANTKGLSVGEITQSLTSSIVTPQMVKNLSIATGMAKEKLVPFLRSLKPAARNIVIQALLKNQEPQTPEQSQINQ